MLRNVVGKTGRPFMVRVQKKSFVTTNPKMPMTAEEKLDLEFVEIMPTLMMLALGSGLYVSHTKGGLVRRNTNWDGVKPGPGLD